MAQPPSPDDVPLGELPKPDPLTSPTGDDLQKIVLSDALKTVDGIYEVLDGSKFNPAIQALMADEGLWALHQCTEEELRKRGFPYKEYFIDAILRKVCVQAYTATMDATSPAEALFAWQSLEPYTPVIERTACPELTAYMDDPERSPNPDALRKVVRIVRENTVASIDRMLNGALDTETMEEFLRCIRIGEEAVKIFGRNAVTLAQATLCNERLGKLDEIAIALESTELVLLKATSALVNGKLTVAVRETANVRAEEELLVRDVGDKPLLRELQEYLHGLYDRIRAMPNACFQELRRAERRLERHVSHGEAVDDRPFDKAVRDVVRLYRLIEEILPDEEAQLDHVRLAAVLELIMEARETLSLLMPETAQEAASAIVEVGRVRAYFTQSLALIFRNDDERLHARLENRVLAVAQVLEDCEKLLIKAAQVRTESIDLTAPPPSEQQS